jgi:membrane protease YdiL (CAAX protease family)
MKRLPDFLDVPWSTTDAVNVFITSWLLVPIVLTLILRWAALHFVTARAWLQSFANGDITAYFIFSLLTGLLGLTVVYYYVRKYRVGPASLGLRPYSPAKAATYLVVAIAFLLVSIPVLFTILKLLVPTFNVDQAQVNEFTSPQSAAGLQLSFLALVIVPPITEELIFRGFIFPAIAKRWGLVIGAILTSLLFGFAHLQANVGVFTIVLSLILCLMYVRLGSIIPGIALHMLNNYLAFAAKVHK